MDGALEDGQVPPWEADPQWFGSPYLTRDGAFSELRRAVSASSSTQRRHVAWWAAGEALQAGGLADDPRVAPTLESVVARDGPALALQTEQLMREVFTPVEGSHIPETYLPLRALEAALGADPADAVVGAVREAARDAWHRSVTETSRLTPGSPDPTTITVADTAGQDLVDRAIALLRAESATRLP